MMLEYRHYHNYYTCIYNITCMHTLTEHYLMYVITYAL